MLLQIYELNEWCHQHGPCRPPRPPAPIRPGTQSPGYQTAVRTRLSPGGFWPVGLGPLAFRPSVVVHLFVPRLSLSWNHFGPLALARWPFDLMSWCIILFIVGAWVESLTACRGLCYSLVCYGVVPLTLTALCYGDVDVHLGSFLGGPWSVPTQLDMKSSHPA